MPANTKWILWCFRLSLSAIAQICPHWIDIVAIPKYNRKFESFECGQKWICWPVTAFGWGSDHIGISNMNSIQDANAFIISLSDICCCLPEIVAWNTCNCSFVLFQLESNLNVNPIESAEFSDAHYACSTSRLESVACNRKQENLMVRSFDDSNCLLVATRIYRLEIQSNVRVRLSSIDCSGSSHTFRFSANTAY